MDWLPLELNFDYNDLICGFSVFFFFLVGFVGLLLSWKYIGSMQKEFGIWQRKLLYVVNQVGTDEWPGLTN